MKIYACKFCDKKFLNGNAIGGHTGKCLLNPNRQKNIENCADKVKVGIQKYKQKKIDEYEINPKHCIHCNCKLNYFEKHKKYCNSSCSASFNNCQRQGKKRIFSEIALKNIREANNKRKGKERVEKIVKSCKECKDKFLQLPYQKSIFCSKKCSNNWRKKNPVLIKRSKNEILFANLCESKFSIKTNFFAIEGWDTDIFISSLNLAIFWNGPWHYEKMYENQKGLLQTQNRDKIKEKLYKENGIKIYIIKDLTHGFSETFVKNEFEKLMEAIPSLL